MGQKPNIEVLDLIATKALETFRVALDSQDPDMIDLAHEQYKYLENRLGAANGPENIYNLKREDVSWTVGNFIIQAALGTGSLSILGYQVQMDNMLNTAYVDAEFEKEENNFKTLFWFSVLDSESPEKLVPLHILTQHTDGFEDKAAKEYERISALSRDCPYIPESLQIDATKAMKVYDSIKLNMKEPNFSFFEIQKAGIHLAEKGEYSLVHGMLAKSQQLTTLPINAYKTIGLIPLMTK